VTKRNYILGVLAIMLYLTVSTMTYNEETKLSQGAIIYNSK